jgi:hypothetical protein
MHTNELVYAILIAIWEGAMPRFYVWTGLAFLERDYRKPMAENAIAKQIVDGAFRSKLLGV